MFNLCENRGHGGSRLPRHSQGDVSTNTGALYPSSQIFSALQPTSASSCFHTPLRNSKRNGLVPFFSPDTVLVEAEDRISQSAIALSAIPATPTPLLLILLLVVLMMMLLLLLMLLLLGSPRPIPDSTAAVVVLLAVKTATIATAMVACVVGPAVAAAAWVLIVLIPAGLGITALVAAPGDAAIALVAKAWIANARIAKALFLAKVSLGDLASSSVASIARVIYWAGGCPTGSPALPQGRRPI